jgi:hypothetical protein
MVDEKQIAFNPAVELSYLAENEQQELYNTMQSEDCTPVFGTGAADEKAQSGRQAEHGCHLFHSHRGKAQSKGKIQY